MKQIILGIFIGLIIAFLLVPYSVKYDKWDDGDKYFSIGYEHCTQGYGGGIWYWNITKMKFYGDFVPIN